MTTTLNTSKNYEKKRKDTYKKVELEGLEVRTKSEGRESERKGKSPNKILFIKREVTVRELFGYH